MSAWTNKHAVICGGSRGLGLALARELVFQGVSSITILGRDSSQLAESKAELLAAAKAQSLEVTVESLVADLTDQESTQQCALQIARLRPQIDLVIQAIGVSDRGSLLELSRERLHELIDANVVTSLHAMQCFAAALSKHCGVMVLIGSLSSLFAPRFLGGYSVAKHGLLALAQQARLELAEQNIGVTLCCPGPISRPDAGTRYANSTNSAVPAAALRPGGGAKLKGLDSAELAKQILAAAAKRQPILILPKKAWWLRLVSSLSPSLGDRILSQRTS